VDFDELSGSHLNLCTEVCGKHKQENKQDPKARKKFFIIAKCSVRFVNLQDSIIYPLDGFCLNYEIRNNCHGFSCCFKNVLVENFSSGCSPNKFSLKVLGSL
jgi:hypothetical protein